MTRRKKYKGCFNSENYWQSANYNSLLMTHFRNRIMSLAMTRFKWVNLPATCNERYLEWALLTDGMATIAYPESQPGIFYSTSAVTQTPPNVYDNPTKWRSVGNNGWNFDVTSKNGVIVYDNLMRRPLLLDIELWARELVDIIRTQQMNRMHQRVPFILTGNQDKELDMLNIYKQIAGFEPAVIATDGISSIDINAIQTGVSYLGKELDDAYEVKWNQIYLMLGIRNLPFKGERMIEDEVLSQSEPTELAALDPLTCRREALEELLRNPSTSRYFDREPQVMWRQDWAGHRFNYAHDPFAREQVENE